jgi:hypothetical protein
MKMKCDEEHVEGMNAEWCCVASDLCLTMLSRVCTVPGVRGSCRVCLSVMGVHAAQGDACAKIGQTQRAAKRGLTSFVLV